MSVDSKRFTGNTIDSSEWVEIRRAHLPPAEWWVALFCNENGGEHTKIIKTNIPHEWYDKSPIKEGNKSWALSNLVQVEDEQLADSVIELMSGQIRGSISKASWIDVLAKHFNLVHYGSFSRIFKISNADSRLTRVDAPVVLAEN